MPSPRDFLENPREAELAERVWRISVQTTASHKYADDIHRRLASIPWMNQRIIIARDWITQKRESGLDGGVTAVNAALNVKHAKYTESEIGNVEHFYVAAVLGAILPNNPVWMGIMSFACLTWEMIVGPARIAWVKRNESVQEILRHVNLNFIHNVNQYSNADVKGLIFGEFFSMLEVTQALLAADEFAEINLVARNEKASKIKLTKHAIVQGDSLSRIAQAYYRDSLLWPVLYEANRNILRNNPNLVRADQVIDVPDISHFSQVRMSNIRVMGKKWMIYK